jgi:hypothetical protein
LTDELIFAILPADTYRKKIMRNQIYFGIFCFVAITGCSKNESDFVSASIKTASVEITAATLTIPDVPGYTPKQGIEPGKPIPFPIPKTFPVFDGYIENWGGPGSGYIDGTCLLRIAHLEEGSTYHQINNDKINMAFYSGDGDEKPLYVRRLKPTTPAPYGWTPLWNTLPDVENEHPEVLFTSRFERSIIIVLSKPCVKFGFELSPNLQNEVLNCGVFWGNFAGDLSRGSFDHPVQSPGGAVLYSVMPVGKNGSFTVVTINFYPRGEGAPMINPEGIALANIRYQLAE